MSRTWKTAAGPRAGILAALCLGLALLVAGCGSGEPAERGATPLRIGYSDWPGWVMWEIAKEKGFFEKNGVDVELAWMDYVPSMEAFAAGRLDGVSMTNGDALVMGASSSKPSVGILVNDYSNGNDMIIGRPGINTVADLKGKKVGVEVGFVDHLLLLKALESAGLTEADVQLVNIPTNETPQALAAGAVDAIGAWQPSSGQALKTVPGSRTIYTSADAPGIIYDMLFVSRESLGTRREDWKKVVRTWYDVIDFARDPANREEMLRILSARVGLPPEEYEPLLSGTYLLPLDEVLAIFNGDVSRGFASLAGSNQAVDQFNVKYKVYPASEMRPEYLDASLTEEVARERGLGTTVAAR